jgi:hemolysin activation/secretion protein
MPTPVRFLFLAVAALAGGLVTARAQPLKSAPAAAAAPAAAPAPAPVYHFTRLLIADTEAKAAAMVAAPDAGPVVVQDLPVLASKELADAVAAYVGQPITDDLVHRLASVILAYLQKHDRLIAGFVLPPPQNQHIDAGEIRLAVLVGRFKQLRFQGNRWFSRELLESRLGVKPGDEVRASTLEEATNWANTNPFRHIKVLVNDLKTEPGMADLIVDVQEAYPIRFATSYDNSGNAVIGQNHYTASAQFGNLWGVDHQGSVQFTTTDNPRIYQAYVGDYRLPLPWRHYIQLAGAYSLVQPTFGGVGGNDFSLRGENFLANLRYVAPVEHAPYSLEFSASLDFKRTNNNLEYTGYGTVRNTKNDIFQLNLGTTAVRRDRAGAWVFGVNLSLSPGNIDSRNSDDAFAVARPNGYTVTTIPVVDSLGNQIHDSSGNTLYQTIYAPIGQSRYAHGTLSVQRLTTLPAGFQLVSRGLLQMASANLIGTEALTLGGQATVRGYNDNITSGDEGFALSNELQGPVWQTPLSMHGRRLPPMQSRLVAFWDYGKAWNKHVFGSDLPPEPLMGAGLGLRCNVGTNFNLVADYGWQLIATAPPQPNHHRASIKASLAY